MAGTQEPEWLSRSPSDADNAFVDSAEFVLLADARASQCERL
jgi:hypothetical protein